MSEWIKKSIKIANSDGYLDKLHQIYPVGDNTSRILTKTTIEKIKMAYVNKNRMELINSVLDLERFPFKDPYVALLHCQNRKFLKTNPQTVNRITDKLLKLDFNKLIDGAQTPKEANTQIGPQFRRWLRKQSFPFMNRDAFQKSAKGICFLDGSDKELFEYATKTLHSGLDKEPDFIAKAGEEYVIGEAKFITASGGHQNTSLQDALRMVKGTQGRAHRVAILDGIIWFESGGKMFQTIKVSGSPILTALLLTEYLNKI